ncbi:hypothetical protein Cflav_PD5060 [Pedosphaera parvula Ellin514]|uniref:Uncharacterized protein n=1 Tax=Pedosphaera parvula (strain Ellin514) TaxID=320771 RepID=B9XBV7_PEDPL|nr:hypothetical protein Cflav_PD5060 [Pedosphaera parvula Ellin514]
MHLMQCDALLKASHFSLHRLALISNRTVEVGESAEVTTANGSKAKVHCIDIKESSVFIKVESQPEPIELHLHKDFHLVNLC